MQAKGSCGTVENEEKPSGEDLNSESHRSPQQCQEQIEEAPESLMYIQSSPPPPITPPPSPIDFMEQQSGSEDETAEEGNQEELELQDHGINLGTFQVKDSYNSTEMDKTEDTLEEPKSNDDAIHKIHKSQFSGESLPMIVENKAPVNSSKNSKRRVISPLRIRLKGPPMTKYVKISAQEARSKYKKDMELTKKFKKRRYSDPDLSLHTAGYKNKSISESRPKVIHDNLLSFQTRAYISDSSIDNEAACIKGIGATQAISSILSPTEDKSMKRLGKFPRKHSSPESLCDACNILKYKHGKQTYIRDIFNAKEAHRKCIQKQATDRRKRVTKQTSSIVAAHQTIVKQLERGIPRVPGGIKSSSKDLPLRSSKTTPPTIKLKKAMPSVQQRKDNSHSINGRSAMAFKMQVNGSEGEVPDNLPQSILHQIDGIASGTNSSTGSPYPNIITPFSEALQTMPFTFPVTVIGNPIDSNTIDLTKTMKDDTVAENDTGLFIVTPYTPLSFNPVSGRNEPNSQQKEGISQQVIYIDEEFDHNNVISVEDHDGLSIVTVNSLVSCEESSQENSTMTSKEHQETHHKGAFEDKSVNKESASTCDGGADKVEDEVNNATLSEVEDEEDYDDLEELERIETPRSTEEQHSPSLAGSHTSISTLSSVPIFPYRQENVTEKDDSMDSMKELEQTQSDNPPLESTSKTEAVQDNAISHRSKPNPKTITVNAPEKQELLKRSNAAATPLCSPGTSQYSNSSRPISVSSQSPIRAADVPEDSTCDDIITIEESDDECEADDKKYVKCDWLSKPTAKSSVRF